MLNWMLLFLFIAMITLIVIDSKLASWRKEWRQNQEELNELLQSLRHPPTANEVKEPAPTLTSQERLQELEELREAGKIDAVEHHRLRKKILEGV